MSTSRLKKLESAGQMSFEALLREPEEWTTREFVDLGMKMLDCWIHEANFDDLDKFVKTEREPTFEYFAKVVTACRKILNPSAERDCISLEVVAGYDNGRQRKPSAEFQELFNKYWIELGDIAAENGTRAQLSRDLVAIFDVELDELGLVHVEFSPMAHYDHFQYRSEGFPWDSKYYSAFAHVPADECVKEAAIAALFARLEEMKPKKKKRKSA